MSNHQPTLITTLLTTEQFQATMASGMEDITAYAENRIDIWPYVAMLSGDDSVMNYVLKNRLVGKVYRNNSHTYVHVLLPTDEEHVFVAVVLDQIANRIYGHYHLDLTQLYQL